MPIPVANSSRKVLRAALLVATLAALLYQFPTHILLKHRAAEPKAAAADMDPSSEIEYDMPGVLRLHKSGRVERFDGTETVPPSPSGDPANGVASKDVVLDPEANISARLYLPAAAAAEPGKKLPVVVFFHGGAFMVHTAASPLYHKYAASLAAAAPAVVVSVDYRLAPEHKFPAAYDDGEAVLRHLAAASLPVAVDLSRCFLAGDSAGGNIAHHVAHRWTSDNNPQPNPNPNPVLRIAGIILLQPYFGGEERTQSEISLEGKAPVVNLRRSDWSWRAFLPAGADRNHPAAHVTGEAAPEPDLGGGFPRAMVVVGGLDPLQDWQRRYAAMLLRRRDGDAASVRLEVFTDAIHGFYMFPKLPDSGRLVEEVRAFIKTCSAADQ